MNQKEKKSESQLVQLVSSLMSGVLLAFGISVLSAVGCFCGGVYTALSCRKRMLLLGVVTGVVYYVAWTIIGLLCYSDVAVLDGVRNFVAAVIGGAAAGFLCAGLHPKRK